MRIEAADSEAGNWMTHGRTYDEQRFSPLKQIDARNVRDLKLAWHFDVPADHRGQEATPLVIDGVMYVTSAWSKVFALDARTGALLWEYDPAVSRDSAVNACCDVVNRGVAAWNGKVYLRHARRPTDCARCRDREGRVGEAHRRPEVALHDHRRAARREGQCAHRQRRR